MKITSQVLLLMLLISVAHSFILKQSSPFNGKPLFVTRHTIVRPQHHSRCGRDKELYWNLKAIFDGMRDKSKKRPRELDFEDFSSNMEAEGGDSMTPEEIQKIWLATKSDFESPASFREFLLMCDTMKFDDMFYEELERGARSPWAVFKEQEGLDNIDENDEADKLFRYC